MKEKVNEEDLLKEIRNHTLLKKLCASRAALAVQNHPLTAGHGGTVATSW